MRPMRVSTTLLVLMVSYCSGSIVCEKVNLADLKGQTNNLCYNERSKQIMCPRNQTLLIQALLQRVHSPDEEDPSSCRESARDNYYDIGKCLLNTTDVQEKTAYEAAMREVLEECSQKRYCILESDKTSSIHGLKDLPVGEGNRHPSHLVVMNQCVKEQVASVVLCDSETQTENEVYISSNPLRMSALGTSTCTCTVSGAASQVTLLDMRLGNSNRTRLTIRDRTRSVYTAHGGQQTLHFMEDIRMRQSEWSLHMDVVPDHLPDKIWMRVKGSIVCEKVNLADLKGKTNNLCYNEESKQIKCPRNQRLLIQALLQRVHSPEEEDPSSCSKSFSDNFYDIGRCLLNTSDVQEKTAYEAAIREVLEECSQKRYCILESDKTSSIHGLKDLPVGEENRHPSHLVVMNQCVKEQVASVVLCDSETQTDNEVYISSNLLRMSALGTSTCTCTVSGAASQVTLLDVRLGNSNRTRLTIWDRTRSVYTAHGGQQTLHFMEQIKMRQSEWSLQVDVVQDHLPDKIWMRVQGNNNSTKVTVTCDPSAAKQLQAPDQLETDLKIIFLVVGFVLVAPCWDYLNILYEKETRKSTLCFHLPHGLPLEGMTPLSQSIPYPINIVETAPSSPASSTKSQGTRASCRKDPDNPMSLSNLTIDHQNKPRQHGNIELR
ncbi:uncharacterized protein LOC124263734 isoform X2 [Haliotis rubra]|uniref:uncharacterized protein LOC124263734 isoform X2 n=1 Tax=Haliotis rubra TaxID=36100 RepID=UPI001EE5304E|nr:uncharacterized protein LOC124263734 isoform X2 [Haliotis rubra]